MKWEEMKNDIKKRNDFIQHYFQIETLFDVDDGNGVFAMTGI